MRILTRYILFDLAKVFLATLIALTLLMLLVGMAQEIRNQGLGLGTVIRVMPYLLPNALRFAVPGTILFAACTVYGRMSASNEIVAVKSLGISPWVFLTPAVVLASLLSLFSVWLNDIAVSWGKDGLKRVVVESVEEIAYSMLRTHSAYSKSGFSINAQGVDGRTLLRPLLMINPSRGSSPVTIMAETAELQSNPEAGELIILLTNFTAEYGENLVYDDAGTFRLAIPLVDTSKKGRGRKRPSLFALRQIPSEIAALNNRIETSRQSLSADAAYHMLTGDLANLASSNWQRRHDVLRDQYARLYRFHTEPYRRWANGFSCLCFVIVGAPLAVRFRNAHPMTTFFLCFLPILVLYYPALAFTVSQAKCGALPPYFVWLGNITLCSIGAWFLRSVMRY